MNSSIVIISILLELVFRGFDIDASVQRNVRWKKTGCKIFNELYLFLNRNGVSWKLLTFHTQQSMGDQMHLINNEIIDTIPFSEAASGDDYVLPSKRGRPARDRKEEEKKSAVASSHSPVISWKGSQPYINFPGGMMKKLGYLDVSPTCNGKF